MLGILIVLCILLYGIYAITTSKYDYWKKKKVPYEKPVPLFGNYADYMLFRRSLPEIAEELCKKYEGQPYFGTYYGTEPALMILDPELLKLVFTKDFYYFNGREVSEYSERDYSTKNLFHQGGDKWKVIRQNMTPMFSSSKMKKMFYLIEKCSRDFEKLLDADLAKTNGILETKAPIGRFTIACIGSCVFGVETGTLEAAANIDENFFYGLSRITNEPSSYLSFRFYARAMWPRLFYGLKWALFPRVLYDRFYSLLTDVFKNRSYKPSTRNDFVDLLLKFNENKTLIGDSITNMKTGENKKYELEVNDELLIAQCLVLFVAGFDTSATTSSFLLFELAKKPDLLKRVQAEVDSYLARNNNHLTYECVSEMPLLEACFNETLRLYPVLGVITREVEEDYTMPSGLRLEKGLRVHLPTRYIQRNPKYFDNPLEFIPERFLPENKHKIQPYTYFPFGEGPRLCIGLRFAKMQSIPGLITILKKYDISLADGMSPNPKIDPRTFVIQTLDGVMLKYTLRQGWENRVYAS